VLALVVPKAGMTLDLDALAEHAAERLARYKLPRQFEVRDELPKTPTGKISKGPLREQFGTWTTSTRAALK
jgi:acyl-CoA synthetase (AMP-forming)/AMP-acid ligase II